MNLRWSVAATALLAAGAAVAQDTSSEKGKLSYAIGYQIGNDFVERKMDVDINTIIRAMQDGYTKKSPAVSEEVMREVLGKMQQKMMTEAKAEFDKLAGENKAKSQRFMAENKAKKGVVATSSGLQYRVIEEGTGARATANSEVTVHYRGSLSSGLEFDSSFARGEPVHFKVNSVIKGWQEALPLMRVGDHWTLFVPPELAYGERGQPPRIGPNEALVFEIKLIEVK
ncbi:FKBP-type peptidyl-prolyl cis-trans isomerase [Tahibacter amnicola]|uniref:Peptidyl-prolyl cis-trans isomerase n=1 Tax=Tahibacter amnicola TaxID=2976241 RepID=A0ABY6BBF9_9GAMM|nr:FKBP-type peptidyl-prolyl cis-trans isomerase [Tahibacter amnicola]UXI67199.1 FKBP-type peptidyl-prolyl cis-trans isomerase [Tahibacter amnicola]